jgi:hypothetical protein
MSEGGRRVVFMVEGASGMGLGSCVVGKRRLLRCLVGAGA